MGEVDRARLDRDKSVESARIETLKTIELLDVEKDKQIRVTNEIAESDQDRARIMRRFYVEMERLTKDEEIAQAEISKNEKIKLAETTALRKVEDASITAGREIDELRISARKYIDRFEIERQKEIEIVDKERLIAVINKSIEEAYARTNAAEAHKALAAMEEQVLTARDEEAANRAKRIDLISAESRVEREAMRMTSHARAEKEATEFRSLARISEANADEVRYEKDAIGQRLINESENMRSDASRRSAIYENLVRNLPNIIRETVKPMENIDSIKILQVDGLPGLNSPSEIGGGGGGGAPNGDGGNMTDRVVNSAMKYRTQVALVDGLMKELGLPIENIGSAGGMSVPQFPRHRQAEGQGRLRSGRSDNRNREAERRGAFERTCPCRSARPRHGHLADGRVRCRRARPLWAFERGECADLLGRRRGRCSPSSLTSSSNAVYGTPFTRRELDLGALPLWLGAARHSPSPHCSSRSSARSSSCRSDWC